MKAPSEPKLIGFSLKSPYFQTTPLHTNIMNARTKQEFSFPYLMKLQKESSIDNPSLASFLAQKARLKYQ
jgi:hypothetical protein